MKILFSQRFVLKLLLLIHVKGLYIKMRLKKNTQNIL